MLPLGLLHLGLSALLFSAITPVSGRVLKPPSVPIVKVAKDTHLRLLAQALPPLDTVYYFDQLIDHNDPSKGTFKQRYWHTAEHYKPGGPIILFNGGEVNAENLNGYLTNSTLTGVIAEKYGGTPIVLEHRFFGLSNPYPNLNEESLKYLTVQQAIEDNVYFAKNVVLPQDNATELGPDKVPWILVGGSYPGALVSWTMVAHPDVFWIGYASSAVVEAQLDFWQYFLPIAENMPKNCSADVSAVIEHVDSVLKSDDQAGQEALKSMFGFPGGDNVAFASALKWDLFQWQDMQPYTGPGAAFYQFCDALEVKDGQPASEDGWGLDYALPAWAKHFNSTFAHPVVSAQKARAGLSLRRRDDHPVDDDGRSWDWIICNELGFALDGPPEGERAVVSRLDTWQSEMQICAQLFPTTFADNHVPDIEAFNQRYQGWDVKMKRIFFANGKNDPWRELTVSALNSTTSSTDDQPIGFSNGFHCSDLVVAAGVADPTILDVQNKFIGYVETWLGEWGQNTGGYGR